MSSVWQQTWSRIRQRFMQFPSSAYLTSDVPGLWMGGSRGQGEAALHESYAFLDDVLWLYPVPQELSDRIMLGPRVGGLFNAFLHGLARESDFGLASATTA
jgi:hypothetical protein